MAKLNISKVGKATSAEGVVVDFTPDILREVAATYDPNLCEAPLVVGHPQLNSPSFGFVGKVDFADGFLVAEESQVDPDFNELRRKGNYKHPSASFFTPTAPNNPTPGKWYLRHVGYLGGATPALKGLNGRVINFAGTDTGVVTVSFSDGELPAYAGLGIARIFRRMRDYFISTAGLDKANEMLPDWEIQSLSDTIQQAIAQGIAENDARGDAVPALTSFSDPTAPIQKDAPMTDAEKAELAALRAQNKTLLAEKTQALVAERHAENVSFADGLVAQARWPSDHRDILVATLDHLAQPPSTGAIVSFGDGDAAQPLHLALRQQLEKLPPMVSFGEVAGKRSGDGGGNQADNNRAVAQRARAYRAEQEAAGNYISFADAVEHINTQK